MDAGRFDAISRALGTASRRRGMLRAAAGGALGLLGVSRLSESASAKRCDFDDDCSGNDICDRDRCVECARNKDCKKKERCENNKCVECKKDSDCNGTKVCKNKKCRRP